MKKSAILLMVATALLAAACSKAGSKGKKATGYKPVKVQLDEIVQTVKSTGIVQPENRVVVMPPVAGRVEDVLVREGQYVKKGQTLVLMSSDERAALLDAARAKGPEELKHWEDLYKAAPLLSPLSGTIIARNFEPGQSASVSDSLLVLADHLIVKAQVDETDIGKVKVGQACSIVLDAYADQPVPGRVFHIAYEAKTVSNVTTYEVDVAPKQVPSFMRSGMTNNVSFEILRREDVLLLPSEALSQEEDGTTTVLLPNPKDPKAPTKAVVVTGVSDGGRIEIVSGLKEGDTVLVAGLPQMSDSLSSPFMMKRPNMPRQGGGARSK